MHNLRGAPPFDRGRKAAREGKRRKDNPFDFPDWQSGETMKWERAASEWDEGFDSYVSEPLKGNTP